MLRKLDKKDLVNFYKSGYNYHTLRFSDGFILEGKYDMKKYLKNYHIPNDCTEKTVLDIGPANGYFSFEFAKRGATVTAIDRDDKIWKEEINELMGTDVQFQVKDVNTLDESFGKFDIVFCSNVLQHNSDMVGIIEKIRKVAKEKAILCTQIIENKKFEDVPVSRFIGRTVSRELGREFAHTRTVSVYWKPNIKCFKMMAEFSGFRKIESFPSFSITRNITNDQSLYGIIHCSV